MKTRVRKLIRLTAAALTLSATSAYAAVISTPSLTSIFSQTSFGNTPVDVIWLAPGAPIVSPALTSIDNQNELNTLFSLATDPAPIVDAFFVDAIGFCGLTGDAIGCASQPGHELLVDSAFAAGPNGATDIAHELGHNLNLSHVGTLTSLGNLLNPSLNSTVLTTDQVATILASPLVQHATNGSLFIDIRPIAVLAAVDVPPTLAPVPEPQSYGMLLAGLLVLGATTRRRALSAQA
ncbi:MAG: sorting protein [Betaproteobacteria bacterium]|nr:sorting protein [Betaproteobacteria bacterium]